MKYAAWIMGLLLSSSLWAQQLAVTSILADIPDQSSSEIKSAQLDMLLAEAKLKKLTILALLYEIQSFIAHKNTEVAISGLTLRTLSLKYSIGNDRIKAFLPLQKIKLIQMNTRSCDVRITLNQTHQALVDLGTLSGTVILPLSYGICAIESDLIRDFQNITLKKGFVKAKIASMDYDQQSDAVSVEVATPLMNANVSTTIGVIQ